VRVRARRSERDDDDGVREGFVLRSLLGATGERFDAVSCGECGSELDGAAAISLLVVGTGMGRRHGVLKGNNRTG
jgi:hypothetical protein